MSDQPAEVVPCPVRGHCHTLTVHSRRESQSGDEAFMLECPTGRYRFLYIERVYRSLGQMARYTRPRFGWKD